MCRFDKIPRPQPCSHGPAGIRKCLGKHSYAQKRFGTHYYGHLSQSKRGAMWTQRKMQQNEENSQSVTAALVDLEYYECTNGKLIKRTHVTKREKHRGHAQTKRYRQWEKGTDTSKRNKEKERGTNANSCITSSINTIIPHSPSYPLPIHTDSLEISTNP